MKFQDLGLHEDILRAVTEAGYSQPTAIQEQAIPAAVGGKDLLACAQTGTGKTAGFTLPILHRLGPKSRRDRQGKVIVRCLVLTPTRELAAQVEESVKAYGKYQRLSSAVIFGGVNINPQIKLLKRGVDIVVATPGRLLDLVAQGHVSLAQIQILVLDEADRMLDMGFIHDIRRVLKLLPNERQNLMFSATFSDEIRKLAEGIVRAPKVIDVTPRNSTTDLVSQVAHPVDQKRKSALLSHLIKSRNWPQVLVFTRTKRGANSLSQKLEKDGISSAAIHGNKSQSARTKALAGLKDGTVRVLVATDIAARGLDIEALPHVVNYDLPNVPEDYVHRIGRTGRAGSTGEAVSLVSVDDKAYLRDIEGLIGKRIPKQVIEGFEPDPSLKPSPPQQRRGPRPGRSGPPRKAQGQQRRRPRASERRR